MNKALEALKRKWEENPLQVLMVSAFVATAAAKVWEARNDAASRKTWEREVARREMMNYKHK